MLFSLHRSHIDSIHGLPYWALPELTFNEESQLRYHLKRGNSVLIGSARASSQAASTSFPLPANSQSVQRVDYKLYLYISLLGLDSVHKLCSALMLCPGRAESKTKTGGGAPHPHHTTGVEGDSTTGDPWPWPEGLKHWTIYTHTLYLHYSYWTERSWTNQRANVRFNVLILSTKHWHTQGLQALIEFGVFPKSLCWYCMRLGQASILCMRELFRTVVNDGDISEEIQYRGVSTWFGTVKLVKGSEVRK